MGCMSADFCFELHITSENKGKALKVTRNNLTLKGESKIKSESTKRFWAHTFLEAVFTSQMS